MDKEELFGKQTPKNLRSFEGFGRAHGL